ncbi:TetR/AcrR family transcriptional regulator [Paenibacillus sp. GCM10027628]|uniref:TetR/AcrR family transcriptional regulator n=1 Tax=Paenibacillus sp. GCM10027628 TaxID=3273413 RepID=UPI00362C0892
MSDTREHILNVSFDLFLRKSFKEVTLKEIVEKTGMSKGAFYHYFVSKEQLFMVLIDKIISTLFVDYSKFSKDSLYQFYHDYITYSNTSGSSFQPNRSDVEDDYGRNYYLLIFDALRLYPDFQEKLFKSEQDELKAWKEIVHTARNKGEIKSPMSDEHISNLFIYSTDGVGIRNILKGRSEDSASTLLALWDSFYEELKT